MSASAPWSVKGIDAKAREVAKDLARRNGMTLGEWLNQMILQGEDVGALITRERERGERPAAAAAPRPARRIPQAEYYDDEDEGEAAYEERFVPAGRRAPLQREAVGREQVGRESLLRATGYDEPVRARRPEVREEARPESRYERATPFSSAARPLSSRDIPSRDVPLATKDLRRGSIFEGRPRVEEFEEQQYATASDDLGRVARALEGLGSRIETSESRSANAVRSVSHAVESLLSRLERSEAAQEQTRDEIRGKLQEQSHEVLSTVEQLSRRADEERRRSEDERRKLEEDHGLFVERLGQAERLIDAQAERLEGLSGHVREERERMAKLEAGLKNNQTIETVKAVEGALGKLANQLYEGDVRTRETVKDIRQDMVGLSHRLAQMEVRDPERAAQTVVDKVVAKMAQRLEAAEAQTTGAIKTLEAAFRNLEGRLSRAEERGDVSDPEAARSLTKLAADLSRRVEENRQEMLSALQASSREGLDAVVSRFEAKLEAADRRSAAAIERMGQEVFRMADTLNKRVVAVEETNSSDLTRLGSEVAQMAEAIEARAVQTESSHAQALERLGGEIARISERLSAKMTDSERRTAQVLSAVGEQLEQQRDHGRADLSERIRQSEERTARMLEEARVRIDQKLAQVQTKSLLSETVVKPTRVMPDELPSPFVSGPFMSAPFVAAAPVAAPIAAPTAPAPIVTTPDAFPASPFASAPVTPEPATAVSASPGPGLESKPFSEFSGGFDEAPEPAPQARTAPQDDDAADLTARLLNPGTQFKPEFDPFEDNDDEDFGADLMNAPLNPRAPAPVDDDDDSDPFADIDTSRKTAPRLDTRAEARAPASMQAGAYSARTAQRPSVSQSDFDDEPEPGVSVSTRDALAAARAAVRASLEGDEKPLGNLRAGVSRASTAQAKTKGKPGESTLMKAFKASSLAVLLVGGGVGGYLALKGAPEKTGNDGVAPETEATPLAAAIIAPPEAAEADPQNQANLKMRYDLAVQQIEAGKKGAVEVLKAVANQGYPAAEYRLSRLYAGEGNLVKTDNAEARRWTVRAAEGGVTQAMFYLGMQYYNGEGGEQDRSTAAMWFRKAAERGDNDSQFNLGVLYQRGDGVPVNPSEAYKWLSLAGRSGDKTAAAEATKVKAQLSEAQLQKANDAIDRFAPISNDAPPLTTSTSAQG